MQSTETGWGIHTTNFVDQEGDIVWQASLLTQSRKYISYEKDRLRKFKNFLIMEMYQISSQSAPQNVPCTWSSVSWGRSTWRTGEPDLLTHYRHVHAQDRLEKEFCIQRSAHTLLIIRNEAILLWPCTKSKKCTKLCKQFPKNFYQVGGSPRIFSKAACSQHVGKSTQVTKCGGIKIVCYCSLSPTDLVKSLSTKVGLKV